MFDVSDLLRDLGIDFERVGRGGSTAFDAIQPAGTADENSLIFFNRPTDDTVSVLRSSPARVALIEESWGRSNLESLERLGTSLFLVRNPRLVVARLLGSIAPEEAEVFSGVHPTAIIAEGADLHPSVAVGPFAIVGRCTIGAHSRIGAWSIIKDNVTIGSNVVVREHCMIGGAGFGMVRGEDGEVVRIPHIGTTVIEDDVEIFPYANVDRGTLGETRVKRGTKIDHYVHVGHNSVLEEDCIVTAGAIFCGKSTLGARSWMGVGSMLKEGVRVGPDSTVGLGAVVLKDVEAGTTVAGVPARNMAKPR